VDAALRGAGIALAGLATIVSAAKFHGREVRLRREHEGFHSVDFRRDNDPWVELLWQRDRRIVWPSFAVLCVAALFFVTTGTLPLPGPAAAAVLFGWAFAGAFLITGARWARELLRLRACPVWSSLGWFLLPLAFAVAEAALIAWG